MIFFVSTVVAIAKWHNFKTLVFAKRGEMKDWIAFSSILLSSRQKATTTGAAEWIYF